MDVNSVGSAMANYNTYSLFSNLNGSSNTAKVPLIQSVDSTVDNSYSAMKLKGISLNTELDDIKNSIEPNLDLSTSPISSKVIDMYDSIKNGTYKPDYTSIMSSNPNSLYSSINSITQQSQMAGNFINAMI